MTGSNLSRNTDYPDRFFSWSSSVPTGKFCDPLPRLRQDFLIILSGVRLSPLGTAATTGLLYQHQMIDDGDCGAVGGIEIGRGNRSTRRKPAQVPLCPPKIPHDLAWNRTQAVAVGSRRLTSWAMTRPQVTRSRQFSSKSFPIHQSHHFVATQSRYFGHRNVTHKSHSTLQKTPLKEDWISAQRDK
jgi:hypothetical protein